MTKSALVKADAEMAKREYERARAENRLERKRTRLAVDALTWALGKPLVKKPA